VQDGDSLWTIAKKTYGDATLCTAIEKSNHGVTAATIHKGQKLTLPPLDEAQKLAGVSATPTTRPSTIASAGASGSGSASTRATGASTHASAASYVAVPADDGKPRFPVSN
jgi:phage tail protein X